MEIIKFKIPASTSNLGPGFDTFGLAINKYLWVEFEPWHEWQIEISGVDQQWIPSNPSNRIRQVIEFIEGAKKVSPVPGRLKIGNQIPVQKGLGSSGAAILAGICIANEIHQFNFTFEEILNYANQLEGHPDNVSASLYGGFTINVVHREKVICQSIRPPESWVIVCVIPENRVSTDLARSRLPAEVPLTDCIFNIQHSSLLVNAMIFGNKEQLRIALDDRIHQKYRTPFIPGASNVMDAGKQAGAIGCLISGSGSAVIGIVDDESTKPEAVGQAMVDQFLRSGVKAFFEILEIDIEGIRSTQPDVLTGEKRIYKDSL